MSASAAASAAATPDVTAPIKAGKRKKLILIGVAVLLVLLLAGAGTALWLKNRAAAHAAEDAGEEEISAQLKAAKPDPAHPPTFLPLDIFVVNLADRDADRYAQVGLTLEVDNAAFAEQMKAYMPAIRNAILMILAHKTSHELLERSGKEQLAAEILRETVRPMGITIAAPRKAAPASVDGSLTEVPAKKSKAAAQGPHNPVRNVHFSNFIIQ